MLDDILSAVDAHVAKWILQNAILGPLMEHKTCVLCTHNVQVISLISVGFAQLVSCTFTYSVA